MSIDKTTATTSSSSSSPLPPENIKPTRAKHITSGPLGVARILVDLFSDTTAQCPPPSTRHNKKTQQHVRLITIGVSHFCEKARWGLDLLEAVNDDENETSPIYYYYYTEDAHPPALVAFATVPASDDAASQTPMILYQKHDDDDDEEEKKMLLCGSNVILRELCPFLYPREIASDIETLEQDLGRTLGPAVRCVCYHHLLQPEYHSLCSQICGANTSKIEQFLFDKMLPRGIEKGMRKIVQVNERTAAASEAAIRDTFRTMSERLLEQKNGGGDKHYLMDENAKQYGFTAADLTFAALAYPLLRPAEMNNFIPSYKEEDSSFSSEQLPAALVKLGDEMRATRAGQHAMKMYAQHRGTTRVIIKSVGRNRFAWRTLVYPAAAMGVVAAGVLWARQRKS